MPALRLIGILTGGKIESDVKHYVGLPPSLTDGRDTREKMPQAAFLIIEENADGVYLYRYADDGGFAGDTWHANLGDAKNQAGYEYGEEPPIDWEEVSEGIDNVVAHGLSLICKST